MVDERTQELINADLDGELDVSAKAELERRLEASPAARKLHEDIGRIAKALGGMVQEPAPEGLRDAIINAVRHGANSKNDAKVVNIESRRSRRQDLPRFGYALAAGFALGAIGLVAWQVIHSAGDQGELVAGIRGVDAAEMAGTMVRGRGDQETEAANVRIDTAAVKGSATLFEGDGVLILQLDLDSDQPVTVNASYDSAGIRLMGFAQGAVSDASIRSAPGSVGYVNQGDRRFVAYLARGNAKAGEIRLSFEAGGSVVHEATLSIPVK